MIDSLPHWHVTCCNRVPPLPDGAVHAHSPPFPILPLGSFRPWLRLRLSGGALAQTKYPDHPVKVIVALPAGGSVDMIARSLGQKLNARSDSRSSSTTAPALPDRLARRSSPNHRPMATR